MLLENFHSAFIYITLCYPYNKAEGGGCQIKTKAQDKQLVLSPFQMTLSVSALPHLGSTSPCLWRACSVLGTVVTAVCTLAYFYSCDN